jgi:hypothetical protein
VVFGENHESSSISKENLQELQNHPQEGCFARYLHRHAAQAAARLTDR